MRKLIVTTFVLLPALAFAQAENDHLQCYQVRDALNLGAVVDLDSPQLGLAAGCKVSRAKYFCVPAKKTVVSAVDRATGLPLAPLPVGGPDAGDRLCYKVKCPTPSTSIPARSVTDQFGNRTVAKFKASFLCTPAVNGSYQRFVDNGDGTVTDRETGLQWEKKDGSGGGENFANAHDVDNTYSWNTTFGGTTPNGSVFTDFLTKLNGASSDGVTLTGCFADHCDWRLPTVPELRTLLLAPYPCGTNPCIDPIFGPTIPDTYWSATTISTSPDYAWEVYFLNGIVDNGFKFYTKYARAVRGGS